MPIYAYRCSACGHAKDVLQKMSDPLLHTCPACGAETFTKQLTAAGFQLKGTGWYATDFKGGPAPAAGEAGEAGEAGDKAKPADAAVTPATATAGPSTPAAAPAPSASPAPAPAPAADGGRSGKPSAPSASPGGGANASH
jgi:putative FmdB family regulatory protein